MLLRFSLLVNGQCQCGGARHGSRSCGHSDRVRARLRVGFRGGGFAAAAYDLTTAAETALPLNGIRVTVELDSSPSALPAPKATTLRFIAATQVVLHPTVIKSGRPSRRSTSPTSIPCRS